MIERESPGAMGMVADALMVQFLVGAVLATVWLTCWLFFTRLQQAAPVNRILHGLHRVTAILPLAWLLLATSLVVRAYIRLGQWPHGGDYVFTGEGLPEWRAGNLDASTLGIHYSLVTPLGIAALASCLFFPPLHVALGRSSSKDLGGWLIAFALGAPAFVLVGLCDFGGVAEWLDG